MACRAGVAPAAHGQLHFARRRLPIRSMDLHAYVYFAPLGPLEPGIYTLELTDGDRGLPFLVRRVERAAKP